MSELEEQRAVAERLDAVRGFAASLVERLAGRVAAREQEPSRSCALLPTCDHCYVAGGPPLGFTCKHAHTVCDQTAWLRQEAVYMRRTADEIQQIGAGSLLDGATVRKFLFELADRWDARAAGRL
jgi:hypothetical protein